jgi:uncharacterized phage protein (TIGR01671 family)
MRTLKFRVWDNQNNDWLINQRIEDYPVELLYSDHKFYISHSLDNLDNYTIQQYTGLKDKNGKEIYEGDIIQLEGSPISYSIEWDKYQWAINAHGALGYDPDWNIQPFNHCVYERAIVIGNIFENSDLLKQ